MVLWFEEEAELQDEISSLDFQRWGGIAQW
jgi:hypothetical protein